MDTRGEGDPGDFLARVRDALDAQVEAIDAPTRSRLAATRRFALARSAEAANDRSWHWLGAAMAAGLVLALGLALLPGGGATRDGGLGGTGSGVTVSQAAVDETAVLEWLASPEGFEWASDADFYAWLEQETGHAG